MQADFTPTTISTVLWAYAACGYYDRVMCNTLGRRAALCFKDMSLFEVTQVLSMLGKKLRCVVETRAIVWSMLDRKLRYAVGVFV